MAEHDAGKVLAQELEFAEEIELYALRGWLVDNPEGRFADLNPAVSCDVPPATTGSADAASGGGGAGSINWLIALGAVGVLLGGGLLLAGRLPKL